MLDKLISLVLDPDVAGERLFSYAVCSDFSAAARVAGDIAEPYCALVMCNDIPAQADVAAWAKRMIDSGLVYLLAWGRAGPTLEYAFDDVLSAWEAETDSNVVMTVYNASPDIAQVLWEFAFATSPARDYEACRRWVCFMIGDSGSEEEAVRHWFITYSPDDDT